MLRCDKTLVGAMGLKYWFLSHQIYNARKLFSKTMMLILEPAAAGTNTISYAVSLVIAGVILILMMNLRGNKQWMSMRRMHRIIVLGPHRIQLKLRVCHSWLNL